MKENTSNGFWEKLFDSSLEFHRFGIISAVLTVVACVGGIAQWSGSVLSTFQLGITVFFTMTVLALILAVQPVKWILNLAVMALSIDLVFIIYNLLTT